MQSFVVLESKMIAIYALLKNLCRLESAADEVSAQPQTHRMLFPPANQYDYF